jgi:hypothetical protein
MKSFLLVILAGLASSNVLGFQAVSKRLNYRKCAVTAMQRQSFDEEKSGSLFDLIKSPGISLGAGVAGIFALLANRLSVDLEKVTDVQSRADIISVIACSALLLNVLSDQDIAARERDAVPLVGFALKEPLVGSALSTNRASAAKWLLKAALTSVPVTSVHIISGTAIIAAGGVVSSTDKGGLGQLSAVATPILNKAINNGEEVYLPDLQILPGKVEFTYLPINCQSVLILPLPDGGAVVMGTNKAKVLKLNDLNRIRSLVTIFKNLWTSSS